MYKPPFVDVDASLIELSNRSYILTRRDTNVLRNATRRRK